MRGGAKNVVLRALHVCLVVLVAGVASQSARAQEGLVIQSVNLVDVEAGTIISNQDVVIRDGRIDEVRQSSDTRSKNGLRAIDGSGQFLMPGLWDVHLHLESLTPKDAPKIDPQSWYAPLALSYGVMGMRDMGSRTSDILALRAAFAGKRASRQPAPILRVAGQAFSGRNPWGSYDHLLTTETPAQAEEFVKQQVARGIDFIKVHDFLTPEVYRTIVSAARKSGMPVSGHLRPYVGPLEAAGLGQIGFEHMPPELFAYCGTAGQRDADAFYAAWYSGGSGYYERSIAAMYAKNRAGCRDLFQSLAAKGVSITPTLSSRAPVVRRTFDAARRFLPAQYLRLCGLTQSARNEVAASDADAYRATIADVMHSLADAGVEILSGTDGTPENCGVPGLTLLDELDQLVASGLTRVQVLRATTYSAARRSGVPDAGNLKPGSLADLVLLSANPLDGFATLEEPIGIVSAGAYLGRGDILALRERAALYAKSLER